MRGISKEVVDFANADPSFLWIAPARSLVWCQIVVSVAVETNTHLALELFLSTLVEWELAVFLS